MKSALKKLMILVAAGGLVGTVLLGQATAKEPCPTPESAAGELVEHSVSELTQVREAADDVIETAQTDPPAEETAPTLDEEGSEFVEIAGTVACYNQRFQDDVAKANEAITFFLETNGLALIEYQELERKYRTNADVQTGIKTMIDGCPTMILALPPEDGADSETLTATGTTETEEEVKEEEEKKSFKWSRRAWAWRSGNAQVQISTKKDGKSVKAFINNGNGSVGCSGRMNASAKKNKKREKDVKVTLNCTAGSKNHATLKVTFQEKSGKYKKARFSWNGKIDGGNASGSGTATLDR